MDPPEISRDPIVQLDVWNRSLLEEKGQDIVRDDMLPLEGGRYLCFMSHYISSSVTSLGIIVQRLGPSVRDSIILPSHLLLLYILVLRILKYTLDPPQFFFSMYWSTPRPSDKDLLRRVAISSTVPCNNSFSKCSRP